jgi:antimicrobial peptide system SdpB family protein
MRTRDESQSAPSPWTNVYGLVRSLLAFGTLLTLLFNDTEVLFRPMGGEPQGNFGRDGAFGWSLFFLVPTEYLEVARWLSVCALLMVLSGWRPRFTALLHWWVSFSLAASAVVVDGGDHVAAVLTLLLLPIALTDGRKWHWSPPQDARGDRAFLVRSQIALSALLVCRLQVAAIYFHAAVGKIAVPQWANGTAVYYWFTNPSFGAPAWLEPYLLPLITSSVGVTALTWGTIILELALFVALTLHKRWWPYLLVPGLVFHFGILVVHGLVSFFFSIAAALVLYLRPTERPFKLSVRALGLRPSFTWIHGLRSARVGSPAAAP